MAAKLQIEYQLTKDGAPRLVAEKLSALLQSKADQIPPAYMCNNEKLVLIVYEKADKDLKAYVQSLSAAKTANIAIISMTDEGLDELAQISEAQGVKVAGKIFLSSGKKGLFGKFKLDDTGIDNAITFAKTVAGGLFESLKF